MALVKILKDYKPSEGWRPGQMVDITNPWKLIREGKVALVDGDGNEIENPDILMQIQSSLTSSEALELIGQLIDKHPKKGVILDALKSAKNSEKVVTPEEKPVEEIPAEDPSEEDEIMAKVAAIKRKQAVKNAVKSPKK